MTATLERPIKTAATAAADRFPITTEELLARELEAVQAQAAADKAAADERVRLADEKRVAHGQIIEPLSRLLEERDRILAGLVEIERKLLQHAGFAADWDKLRAAWAESSDQTLYAHLKGHGWDYLPAAPEAVAFLDALLVSRRARLANVEAEARDYAAKNALEYRLPTF